MIPKDIFVIDKELMIEKTVFKKLKEVLEVVGIEETEVKSNIKKKSLFSYNTQYESIEKAIFKEITTENIEDYLKIANEKLNEKINSKKT